MIRGGAGTQETITALSPRLADGSLSAEALLQACLDQIEAHDRNGAGLSAILRLNPDAMDWARRLDADLARTGRTRGPLHGVPLVLKDNIDMAGLPTTSGSRAMAGAMPRTDAEQTRRLIEAGAVIVAKTNLSEFSFEIRSRSSLGGDTLNPFDPRVTSGGSSGGAAAAVAAGFALAGVGTDTGGSIRTPSAYCGLVGLRPTHGLLDMRGVAPLAPSTDTIGPLGRSVDDVALLFGVMAGADVDLGGATARGGSRGLFGARLGVVRQAFGADSEIAAALQQMLDLAADAGARLIDPVALPDDLLPGDRPHVVDWAFGPAFNAYLSSNFAPGSAPRSLDQIITSGDYLAEYRPTLARRAAVASLDHDDYRAILAYHAALREALSALMDRHRLDALIYPTSAVIPTSLDNPAGGWAPELAACSGWPALTLPAGRASSGVPIGLELLSRAGSETRLLELARRIERLAPRRYRPDLERPVA